MSQFERDLRESLRRRKPPSNFEAKVLARTRESRFAAVFPWRWVAVAASVVLMIGGMIGATMLIQEQRRQSEGEKTEKAKQELMIAFRITGSKVREIQARLDSFQKRVVYPPLNP